MAKRNQLSVLIILICSFITIFPTYACTIFTASKDGTVYFGNNEDWINPNSYMMIRPSVDGDYGAIYFGFDNFYYQGGINSHGLCFDGNALPGRYINNHPELLNPTEWIVTTIMKTCTNISEVIITAQKYNWYSLDSIMRYQVHFADSDGNAVVISPGLDGEINFTRKNPGDGFLISTNYNLSYGNHSNWCWRYDTVDAMLNSINDEEELNVEFCRDILDSVHQEGDYVNTYYSNIFDLKNKQIYLYYFSQFKEEVAIIDVTKELSSDTNQNIPLTDLFSSHVVNQAESIHNLYITQRNILILLGDLLFILDLVALLIILWFFIKHVKG